jgi:dihydroorotase
VPRLGIHQNLGNFNFVSDRIFNSEDESFYSGEISVTGGRFSKDTTGHELVHRVELKELIVTPGLADFHTHVFLGQDLGLDPDSVMLPTGVTTAIDAGSAGGHLFGAFKNSVIDPSLLRVKAFLNIASIGTTSILLQGELKTPAYCNEELAFECAMENSGDIIGIKVRPSRDVGGGLAYEGLEKARRVATRLGKPLMVHLGPAPVDVDAILDHLSKGDILTHAYTGWAGNTLLERGKPRPAFLQAKERGVFFDIGHGMGGFDSTVSRTLIEAGHLPDAISTDLHAYSKSVAISLPEVMSKFLALGLSLEQVLTRVTRNPILMSGLADQGLGSFADGSPADLAVFEIVEKPQNFKDCHGHVFSGTEHFVPVIVICGGRVVYDRDRRIHW